jgi:carbonic anhydrase
VVAGKLIFPQCSEEIRERVMMEYQAQRNGQDFKEFMKSQNRPIPKFEIKSK